MVPEVNERRAAFNIMPSMPSKPSMPAGTADRWLRQAAGQFAKAELANHCCSMVWRRHQANSHVHITVRAEGRDSKRLNLLGAAGNAAAEP